MFMLIEEKIFKYENIRILAKLNHINIIKYFRKVELNFQLLQKNRQ